LVANPPCGRHADHAKHHERGDGADHEPEDEHNLVARFAHYFAHSNEGLFNRRTRIADGFPDGVHGLLDAATGFWTASLTDAAASPTTVNGSFTVSMIFSFVRFSADHFVMASLSFVLKCKN
jgi:hypothetical protein